MKARYHQLEIEATPVILPVMQGNIPFLIAFAFSAFLCACAGLMDLSFGMFADFATQPDSVSW
jgi:hypothetical protein